MEEDAGLVAGFCVYCVAAAGGAGADDAMVSLCVRGYLKVMNKVPARTHYP